MSERTGAEPGAPPRHLAVSAVVCAYRDDRWPLTQRALGSLVSQTRPPEQIVLVVDHNDELLSRARAAFPDVVVVSNSSVRGLSGARNTGVAVSHGDVVAFLDDDAEAAPDWLELMMRHYDVPEVLGVGGHVRAHWVQGRPAWYPAEFEWVVGCSYRGQPTSLAEVRNPIGAGMSFRRAVFETVGGFDASVGRVGSLPVGCEETELSIRARRRWPCSKIIYDPSAVVAHTVPPERATVRYLLARCWSEGISKAAVARLAGAGPALAAERGYVRRTIPRGVARQLSGLRGPHDLHRLASAAAMCAGLGSAAAGYVLHRGREIVRRPQPKETP
ncbi:glycosyltransferase [Georgenia sp. EYE_87]|uniref:glycosyltransferase family 2 protein n=1 Tax=Georgenia sp. EYE_87 TaxID=2853448 RepID=UPI002003F245|nr:glycosyltransferase family 2 protein [Georgenia sp. EYE_87]MCK6209398.1 glycosyltransferase [Georgenia sp. EYE_87]